MKSAGEAATVLSAWKAFAQVLYRQTMNLRALTEEAALWIMNRVD